MTILVYNVNDGARYAPSCKAVIGFVSFMEVDMWKYRSFRAAIVDAAFASILLIPTWFLKPEFIQQIAVFVGIWQPVFILWIVGPEVSQLVDQRNELRRLAIMQAQADVKLDLIMIDSRKKEANRE